MSENKNSLEIEESLIYTRKGHAMITSNPIIECSIFKNDEFNEAYILKSKFDLLEAENQKLKNLLKMKIAGGGGGDLPLEGTGGVAYGVGGEVPKDKIILFSGGAGGESPSEQKIEDNPDFTHNGGDFMKGKSDSIHVSFEAYNELSKELEKVKSELEKVKGGNKQRGFIQSVKISSETMEDFAQRDKAAWDAISKPKHVLCIDSEGNKTMIPIKRRKSTKTK